MNCRTRSASKSKCGHTEYSGYVSSPPKYYLNKQIGGSITQTVYDSPGGECTGACVNTHTTSYDGVCNYNSATCGLTVAAGETKDLYSPCGSLFSTSSATMCALSYAALYVPAQASESFTATSREITGYGVCTAAGEIESVRVVGTCFESLTNEFTTALLVSVAETALEAASWSSYSTLCPGALTTLSSDEVSISLRDMQYRFTFNQALPAGYKLDFDIIDGVTLAVLSHVCIDLGTGITEYEYLLEHPASNGSRALLNWVVTAGTC